MASAAKEVRIILCVMCWVVWFFISQADYPQLLSPNSSAQCRNPYSCSWDHRSRYESTRSEPLLSELLFHPLFGFLTERQPRNFISVFGELPCRVANVVKLFFLTLA